jgi:Zn-dependent protease
MRWSWKIGTFQGITLYVHATMLLLLGWILFARVVAGAGAASTLAGLGFIALLFLCVLLHEIGHALAAQRFGIGTRDITLYPVGGIARLQRIPREPRQELLIALAGPLVNGVIAAAIWVGLRASHALIQMGGLQPVGNDLLTSLLAANLILAVFNLLPAFPMDGGRALRAFLAERMEYGRATHVAARIGQGMAFGFGMLGLLLQPLLLFVALFVYIGATEEAETVETELAFQGVPVRDAMTTRFATLTPSDPLSRAVEQLLAGFQHDFPIVEENHMVGLLTRSALIAALSERGPQTPVRWVAEPAPAAGAPTDSLESTFQRMRESEAQTLPIEDRGRLVGLVTLENLGEFLMVRAALGKARDHGGKASGEALQAGRGAVETAAS